LHEVEHDKEEGHHHYNNEPAFSTGLHAPGDPTIFEGAQIVSVNDHPSDVNDINQEKEDNEQLLKYIRDNHLKLSTSADDI
jgi:hypothetical protein